jgi:hypothetical protein
MASFSGTGAEEGGISGAAIGGAYGGPWGALIGGAVGAIGGGLMGGGTNIGYSPQSMQLLALSRQQWQEAINQQYGLENQLIKYADDPNQLTMARAQAVTDVDKSFAGQEAAQQRALADQGVTLTTAQKSDMDRQNKIAQGMAEAGASNLASQQTYATQRQVMAGGGG